MGGLGWENLVGITGAFFFPASFRDDSAEKDGRDVTTTPLSESQHYLGLDSLVISKGSLGEYKIELP